MNRIEKIVLFVGLSLWVIGDLVTTYIAFHYGLREMNVLTSNIIVMIVMKLGVVLFALKAISMIEKYNKHIFKVPILTQFVFVGGIAVTNNIMQIMKVM